MRSHFRRRRVGIGAGVENIHVSREGNIESITVTGEIDLSNVAALDEALHGALSGTTTSCLLDLSQVEFMDSSVVHTLLRWSKEAQVSAREGLAIMVGEATEAGRVLDLVGLMNRLPVFSTRETATTALEMGQKPRPERPLRWLTDLELAAEREAAQTSSDAATRRLDDATRRLDDAIAEEETRRGDDDAASDDQTPHET